MNDFMDIAVQEAIDGSRAGHGGPFGACVVKEGKVISAAHNRVLLKNDPTLHAEMQAISEAARKLGSFDLSGCELYTSCEPCPMCLGAIYWARIKKVFFAADRYDAADAGFDDKKFYEDVENGRPPEGVEIVQSGREKALTAFLVWNQKEDRRLY